MFILDSLSLTGAATKIKQSTTLESSALSSVAKRQENCVENLMSSKAISAAITGDFCEMIENENCILRQQQHSELQQEQLTEQLVKKFMGQKMPSPLPHEIKEIIKNTNENLNGGLAVEHNTTIVDNTMPQEEQQNDDNGCGNESSAGAEWVKIPATHNCHHNSNNCNETHAIANHQTTNINASTATDTAATITTLKHLHVNNTDEDDIRVADIMLTNIQNIGDLNKFALPPEAAAATPSKLKNFNSSASNRSSSCCCLPHGICMSDVTSEGMLVPLMKSRHDCGTNNDSHCVSATCGVDDDGGGGSFCHYENNNNCNKNGNKYNLSSGSNGSSGNSNSSKSNKNNVVILNTNSFVTVECSGLTCENEREQTTQNGYKNCGNAVTAAAASYSTVIASTVINNTTTDVNTELMAELSNGLGEQEYFSPCFNSERICDPFGNSFDGNVSSADSPMDSVLENFEKFLNAVKQANQSLHQNVADGDDLIDFRDDPQDLSDRLKDNAIQGKCNQMERNAAVFNEALRPESEQHYSDDAKCGNNINKPCNFENLLYCDLNETLEEQNLLESKEILNSLTTAELKPTETVVERGKSTKTNTKVSELKRIGNNVDSTDKLKSNRLMVDEVNETIVQTPVTCINIYSNYNNNHENSKIMSNEQSETCALMQRNESYESLDGSSIRTPIITIETREPLDNIAISNICSSPSIENICCPPLKNNNEKCHNVKQSVRESASTSSIFSCNTNTNTQPVVQIVSAEYKNICHHSQFEQQQQQQQQEEEKEQIEQIQEQFTSAYTLRDLAKCLKPSSDEDILYTFNFVENKKEKENFQKFNCNLNTNQQINSKDTVLSETKKSISAEQVSAANNIKKCSEQNLYNKIFDSENSLKADPPGINNCVFSQCVRNSKETCFENHYKNYKNSEVVNLKDTQFSEIQNFFNSNSNQPGLSSQRARDASGKGELQVCADLGGEQSKSFEDFDNEFKIDGKEKIYTRLKNAQPLLCLAFVWPTKNEGQVVTTRRQGNVDQGEHEAEKKEAEQEYRLKFSNENINDNNIVDESADCCSCECAKRILEKTYGTCDGCHKGLERKALTRAETENNENCSGDLFEQKISIDTIENVKCFPENLQSHTKNTKNRKFILKSENEKEFIFNKKLKEIEIKQENHDSVFPYNKSNFPQTNTTSGECVLPSEKISSSDQFCFENENSCKGKSQAFDIKRNNLLLNKTESVDEQDNGKKILNPNKVLKSLCETKQNINSHQILLHATPTPTINHQHHRHHHHYQHRRQQCHHNPPLVERVEEDQLNLEEFEASQRLKRLLQQHQQFRTRYYSIPTTIATTHYNNYKQTNKIITTTAKETESLKTEISIHLKDDLLIPNNKEKGLLNKPPTTTSTNQNLKSTKTTTTTKANKLQTDCELTLGRSSLLRAFEYQQSASEINRNLSELEGYSNSKEEHKDLNEVKNHKTNNNKEALEIGKSAEETERKVLSNEEVDEEVDENKNNSPQAFITKKLVRLSQQQQQLQANRYIHQQTQIYTNPFAEQQQLQAEQNQQQQNLAVIEKSSNLRLPIENNAKREISPAPSSPKACNLNLQHIVKTKQLFEQQRDERDLIRSETECCSPTTSDIQFDEYKSAFVPTKPEIYKSLKPLTATTGNLTATTAVVPLITTPATLSEFDTQRFSDFLHLNHLSTSVNNNNINCLAYTFKTHVLSAQQQQQQQSLCPLYTTNFIDPIQLPYCYDELFLNESHQQPQQPLLLNAAAAASVHTTTTNTPNVTTDTANNGVSEIDDDLVSISSNNSSPCDCVNCQQEQTEKEIDRHRDRSRDRDRDRDLLFLIDQNVVRATSPNEIQQVVKLQPQQEQKQQTLFKMREVNGQLRGLLKNPNRPPPARKNRVVFDETRNEFFEADYIILIREDCAYDEEDEEPCTCGEHELVRLCCEEGCQCNYSTAPALTDDNRTPQSPKYAPPIEFVDEAALSPPDGYKDNGLKNTLGGALSGHIFGAQHLQQLQVIQRLQQQRAAMLAARSNTQNPPTPAPATSAPSTAASANQQSSTTLSACSSSSTLHLSPAASSAAAAAAVATTVVNNNSMNQSAAIQQHSLDDDTQGVCTECAECAECAAKQLQQDAECNSAQCQEDLVAPLVVPAVALLPIHTSSPERRMTQKEIIAGEERPRYVLQAQYKSSPVSERRIIREATEDLAGNTMGSPTTTAPSSASNVLSAGSEGGLLPPALPAKPGAMSINNNDSFDSEKPPPIPPKETSPTTQISGILKGGKLWKQDSISQHSDDQTNTTSEDEAGSTSNGTIKRSVRFVTEETSNDEVDSHLPNADEEDNQINELIPIKKHSTLFKNALRPNSAVQQLFPSTVSHQTLTSEALRAFDESKRAGCLVSSLPGSAGDTDTLRRTMERNILRRSLVKKKAIKSDISLEERIKQLTCGIDEDDDEPAQENGDYDNSNKVEDSTDLAHRDSPAGEENPQKFNINGNNSDKSFSPNSSVSSSSSGSSAYKKITEIFNREKKNPDKIMEMEENPIVIIPQECRCPAAPDLGMGIQVPVVHTQIHRTPPRQTEPKRQFLSTLAPLTACVAGNKDDLSSYYTLAAAHHNQAAQTANAAEFSLAAMMTGEQNTAGISQSTGDEVRKVAPDVIAGTPGQEPQDELAAFAQQEANRTDKIKKRYGNEPANTKENKETNSDDEEGNDYGFNKRPSVRGIKPKFSSTNEILQQMQEQLSQQMPNVVHSQPLPQPMKSYTLPKQSSVSAMTKQLSQQQPSPQNVPQPSVATSQQQLPQQQQMCSAVAPPAPMQMPANAPIPQQQTEQRAWSFYSEAGGTGEQQRLPVENAAAAMQQTYYQTLPAGAMFRHTMIHQHQHHGPEEAMLYTQNCQAMAATIESQPHYGHYARSPTRRPESPPPLRNYHQTMVLIPYNAETYSQFAATSMDPKVAHIQRQNILEYQQVTQQTIRVPIGYALPGMQLHVVAGRGHAAHYATAGAAETHRHQHQRIMTQRYQFAQEASMAGFSERGVPEGAAAVSHSDCTNSGIISPTSGQQIAIQQQQQQQQQHQQQQLQQQVAQATQQQQQQQQQVNCQQQQQAQPQTQNNIQSAAQGSVYYAMNV